MSGEQLPPENHLRNEALHIMCQHYWNSESFTDETSATRYCRLRNDPIELPEIIQAFEHEFSAINYMDYAGLTGYYIVVDGPEGYDVTEYPTEIESLLDFDTMRRQVEGRGGEV